MTPDPVGAGGRTDRALPAAARDRRPGDAGPPVVLVAHGSPDSRSRTVVRAIAAAADATATFLDFDSPHPVAALASLADAGHRRAILVPLLLTRAFHGRVDVPRIAVEAGRARPGLAIDVTDPVGGPHLIPALLRGLGTPAVGPGSEPVRVPAARRSSSVRRRFAAAPPQAGPAEPGIGHADTLDSRTGFVREPGAVPGGGRATTFVGAVGPAPAGTRDADTLDSLTVPADALVLASAGTRDADTLDSLTALADALGRAAGLPCLAAYASAAKPSVADAVKRLRASGHRRVAVASYFIAPGVLHDRAVAAALSAGAAFAAPPLGAAPELVAAIGERRATSTTGPVTALVH